VFDLALLNQFIDRACYILNRHIWVNAMLIDQVNCLDLESLERPLNGLLDMLRLTVKTTRLRRKIEPELCGDHHLITERGEGFAHEFFVGERAIDFGGIKERDAMFDWLSRIWLEWRAPLLIVKPDTVIGWHRKGFRLFWTRLSRRKIGGRPSANPQFRALIKQMTQANPL